MDNKINLEDIATKVNLKNLVVRYQNELSSLQYQLAEQQEINANYCAAMESIKKEYPEIFK